MARFRQSLSLSGSGADRKFSLVPTSHGNQTDHQARKGRESKGQGNGWAKELDGNGMGGQRN
jgi:hypothetical protein